MAFAELNEDKYREELEKNKVQMLANFQKLEALERELCDIQEHFSSITAEELQGFAEKAESLRNYLRYYSIRENVLREKGKILQDLDIYFDSIDKR